MAIKPEGGGGKAIKRRTFLFSASLIIFIGVFCGRLPLIDSIEKRKRYINKTYSFLHRRMVFVVHILWIVHDHF